MFEGRGSCVKNGEVETAATVRADFTVHIKALEHSVSKGKDELGFVLLLCWGAEERVGSGPSHLVSRSFGHCHLKREQMP